VLKCEPSRCILIFRLIPIAFIVVAAGPLVLYLWDDVSVLAEFRVDALFPIAIIAWVLISILAVVGGCRMAAKNWVEVEI